MGLVISFARSNKSVKEEGETSKKFGKQIVPKNKEMITACSIE